ncbi:MULTISPECIES: DUF423 domain-containing protein [Tenacibaculum]|uniref:DUF423 domain-containing protein n=1 Tax=Tenacibaculum TaxID=104267 RepID=UPI001F0B5C0A|nr:MULTISPECIES: DUF423 domain-containing protein [Tenacibaculum]MCH3880867.1 DUF423 domain-containing protein [Tenacibaculum aquimarinum]MCH3884258.1 DUF423 domain-containing protein [Tenacibaculum aquimarinum]MDO6599534.1 DUF423 domain-containing protein [Tenacibaculum sp. 1_MG-2023]
MYKNLSITAFLGLLAIILGAFGAHALKESLSVDALLSFETAVRYQMYHVIVLLLVNTFDKFSEKQKNYISYLFFAGILCFSGSIYAIQLLNISAKTIWFITPLGGLLFCIGWILLFINFVKKTIKN